MSEQNPEQTAIFTVVPTAEVPRYLELLEGTVNPPARIDTYSIPSTRQEAGRVLGRMLGEGGQQVVSHRVIALGDTVTAHSIRPTSMIETIESDEVVEAITKENLREASRSSRGTPHVGASLANVLSMDRPLFARNYSLLDPYMVTYQPKRSPFRAIRVGKARGLLEFIQDPPKGLWINNSHLELLTHVCELIEANPDED